MSSTISLVDAKAALSDSTPLIIAQFGVQYHEDQIPLEKRKKVEDLRQHFTLGHGPGHVETTILPKRPEGTTPYHSTVVYRAYWFSSSDYDKWWQSPEVIKFWSELEPDAGVWREVMRVNPRRFMHATGGPKGTGISGVPELSSVEYKDIGPEKKYWGRYRERMIDYQTDGFESRFVTEAQLQARKEKGDVPEPIAKKESVVLRDGIPHDKSSNESPAIHHGRVILSHGIDNMFYAWEYQDYTRITDDERKVWKEHFNHFVHAWMKTLDEDRNKHGVLSFRNVRAATPINDSLSLEADDQVHSQLVYYLDLSAFEYSGRTTRDHFKIRMTTEKYYKNPELFGAGKGGAQLSVEAAILKRDEFEAEYVGCSEGTGLMPYEDLFRRG
ncbi:hypothetical protein PT974_04064 [Cladobotryum mycophilum]|uniref:Phenylacetaldoxime dehydratase n=1 Tax=Cladobotryum mycophilum TaxID=491253 RepID=A0ABR0SU06_9HYPO